FRIRVSALVRFFFQAEDGIRDFHVTGVQTCALPICRRDRRGPRHADESPVGSRRSTGRPLPELIPRSIRVADVGWVGLGAAPARSEERRVGKECMYRGERAYIKEEEYAVTL